MTEHKTLGAALAAVQADMPSVHKGKTANVGQYRYTYADLADVSAAILPLLAEHGLAFTCHPRRVDGTNSYELAATLLHSSTDQTVEGALPISGNQPQQIGSAITYGRRYLLGCLTGIVTDDDDDGATATRGQQADLKSAGRAAARKDTRAKVGKPAPETGEAMKSNTRGRLFALLADAPGLADEDQQRTFMGDTIGHDVTSRADLTDAEGRQIIARLEAWQKGEPGAAWAPQAVSA